MSCLLVFEERLSGFMDQLLNAHWLFEGVFHYCCPDRPGCLGHLNGICWAITRLTAHFVCGLMSDLVICKFRKCMVIHDTECPH